jgi:ATP-dependent protease ClpP protease subunit
MVKKLAYIIPVLSFFVITAAHAQLLIPGTIQGRTIDKHKKYVIKIEGAIAFPMAEEFDRLRSKIPENYGLVVELNSPGGFVSETLKLIGSLRQEARQRLLVTSVDNGDSCGSACVSLFVQGTRRFAGEVSIFMFHGASLFPSNVPDATKTNEVLNLFRDAGVREDWLQEKIKQGVFSKPGRYWISGKELVDEKSGIVQKLMERHEIEEPIELPYDPSIRPR